MPRDKAAYDKEYLREHIVYRKVNFNKGKPEDTELLEWIDAQGNTSQYIKQLVREDMEKHKE